MTSVRTAPYYEDQFSESCFDVGMFGTEIDVRTKFSISEVERVCGTSFCFYYDQDDLVIKIGDDVIECHDLAGYFSERFQGKKIILDGTSLDIPELALIFDSFFQNNQKDIFILYIEPETYTEDESYTTGSSMYNLSENIIGFENTGIPGVSMPVSNYDDSFFIVFGGFESSRLLGAFESYEMTKDNSIVVLGAPGFNLGWETICFDSNIKALSNNQMGGAIQFSSASCPASTFDLLEHIKNKVDCSELFILPLGTKPCSLGALLYIIENKLDTRLLFDQPIKKVGRTSGIGRKFMYRYIDAISPHSN